MNAPLPPYPQFTEGPLSKAYRALHKVYVETSVHREANDAIRRLFTSADVFGSHRRLALIGPSGSGKTSAVRNAERWLRAQACLQPEAPTPLPMAEITSGTTAKGLAAMVLSMGHDAFADRGTLDQRTNRIATLAPNLNFLGIAFDEFHHSYEHRTKNEAGKIKTMLKAIVNNIARPIILMGTEGVDAYLDDETGELRSRFRRICYMRNPSITSLEDLKDIQAVLNAMKAVLPCAPDCDITGHEMMLRLLLAAESQFGFLVDLVRRACEIGANQGAPFLQLAHLVAAYRESARRADRVDDRNPFLIAIEIVKSRLMQLRTPVVA
ncbi:TniB family NTP-binding protein [Rhizobacter fulvus]